MGWAKEMDGLPILLHNPAAPSDKDAEACPSFVGEKMWLCTVAQGTLSVGLEGLPC